LAADPSNPAAVVEALRTLARDPVLRAAMGAHGRELAEAKYNWGIEAEHLVQLVDQLAARSTA
jgi:glycosyltransferase involved in cell wall biosynthesis